MGPTDPWEYYMDAKTKKWYTRKKGTDEWIDMEAKLPNENIQKALDKLNSYVGNIISKPVVAPIKLRKGDKIKFNPSNAGVGKNLTVYKYNNMGFSNAGTYRVEQKPNIIYLGQSSSGEYTLVQFLDQSTVVKYWIMTKYLV